MDEAVRTVGAVERAHRMLCELFEESPVAVQTVLAIAKEHMAPLDYDKFEEQLIDDNTIERLGDFMDATVPEPPGLRIQPGAGD